LRRPDFEQKIEGSARVSHGHEGVREEDNRKSDHEAW